MSVPGRDECHARIALLITRIPHLPPTADAPWGGRGYSGSRRLRTSHLFEHRRIQLISRRPSRRAGEARLTARMVEEVPVDCGCGPADVEVQHPPGQALVRDGHGGDVQEGGEQRFKGEGGGAQRIVAVEGAAVVIPNGQSKGQVEKIGNYA
eukprot:scaffold2216_cov72-Isochrysis_galbana.AAC.1